MSLLTDNSSKLLEASSRSHIFTKGPNEQAIGLQHKYGGGVRSLVPQYITPSSVAVPHFKSDVVYHVPGNYNPNSSNLNNKQELRPTVSQIINTSVTSKDIDAAKTILDGFMLLESSGMEFPDDARLATIVNKGLRTVVEEDLIFFNQLVFLDISDNELEFKPFNSLPNIVELRMACNKISVIPPIPSYMFETLLYLDLSYNNIHVNSISSLKTILNLKELDLSGNNLPVLPMDMIEFPSLEKLILTNNKLSKRDTFITCSKMKKLRELNLSYNFLDTIPEESCIYMNNNTNTTIDLSVTGNECFPLLEYLDISFNYFGQEDTLFPLLELDRLEVLLLYGNPVLGPTGEDSLGTYVEDLINASIECRAPGAKRNATSTGISTVYRGKNRPGNKTNFDHDIDDDFNNNDTSNVTGDLDRAPLEIMTEVPRARRPLRKGELLGRQTTYRDFSVVKVDSTVSDRTNRQWKELGQNTLFAESIAKARKEQLARDMADMGTFITAAPTTNEREGEEITEQIADHVMGQVADSMGIGDNAELLALQDIYRANSAMPNSSGDDGGTNSVQTQEMFGDGDTRMPDDKVPHGLFSHPIGDLSEIDTQPMTMNGALRALRFAVQHPLTDDTEVPAKGFLPPHDYVRPTATSLARRLPRVQPTLKTSHASGDDEGIAVVSSPNKKNTMSKSQHAKEILKEKTLDQIDDVLSSLNKNTLDMIQRDASVKDDIVKMKSFARPNTGLSNLVNMVQTVVEEIDERR